MANPLPLLFLFLFLSIFAHGGAALDGRGPMTGGYSKIDDLKDPHIVDIAKFAVSEISEKTGGKLSFVRVASGKQQVVAGMNYDLVIVAADGGARRRYEAVVYERVWEHFRSLTSFKPLK